MTDFMNQDPSIDKLEELDTLTQHLQSVDRAVIDGTTSVLVQLHLVRGADRIVGATEVADGAGELIGQFTLAIQNKIGLRRLGKVLQPYPTMGDVIRKLADQYNRRRLTPAIERILRTWLRLSRRIPW